MLLGLDLGTGSAKALLLDTYGRVVGEGRGAYPVDAPRAGWAETDPKAWWTGVVAAVRRAALGREAEVEALGLSGQMHGTVLCDAQGEPLRPAVLWADSRASAHLRAYRALSERDRRRLANPLTVGMAGPTLLWLCDHEGEVYGAARWALQPKDWLRLKLTGEAYAEPSDASATLLYDLPADGWAFDIAEALGLRADLLAPLVPSSQIAGHLAPAAADALGLPSGLPVAAGAADTAAALLGSGLVRPGEVQLTVGTAAQIAAVRERPVVDSSLRTHLYRAATPEGFYALAAMQNAGVALGWVRRVLGLSWEAMYAEAFAVPAGAEGVTFLPYLTGERTPHLDPEARGTWHGLGLRHARGHLARAAFEGVAFAVKDGLLALGEAGVRADALRLAGGGTVEGAWRGLLADVLEKPLLAAHVPSASARGAALLAGLAVGRMTLEDVQALTPTPEPVAAPRPDPALAEAWERFRDLYPKLKHVGEEKHVPTA